MIDAAREANKMRTANLLLGELGQMFRYAAAREWIQGDPTAAITRKDAGGQDKESDRVLDDLKSSCFVTSLRSPRIEITILRRPEAVLPVHTELAAWWTLAAGARRRSSDHQTQRRRESQVSYLDDPCGRVEEQEAARCPSERIRIGSVGSHVRNSGRWGICFEGRDGGHVSETEVTRRLTDRQTRNKPIKGRKNSTVLDLPGGHWTQHDLRRTGPRSWENSTYHPTLLTSA